MILRIQALIGFLCLALLVYFVMLTRTAIALLRSGTPSAVILGIGVLLLPIVGLWATIATLRAGMKHQRLARLADQEGIELDVSTLPTKPSGRIERDAADNLFQTVRGEVERQPDDWRGWYRLARAYDYAGDRTRAREAMGKAVALQSEPRP